MMEHAFYLYNTLSRTKERFVPLHEPFVGLYVCGPTVYGDAHLGHARAAVTFDVLVRHLRGSGYKVRYVRNITDVGHLVNDADEGEDKIAREARIKAVEPMEIAQRYTVAYHRNMEQLNALPPSIEPLASGHIIEQQELVKDILASGFAYESNGNVYFDVKRYSLAHDYGKLSGRRIDELENNTRPLEGQEGKRDPLDFALWKKVAPGHAMRWPSPWGEGFPGWHLECSCMSRKYLGKTFDIHGGGIDLLFPHHECEIAQGVAADGHESARYWMHNNLITVNNGQKMGKSLNNFITLDQLFSGEHDLLEQAYSPMIVRFFILQAHYRSPLDFSNDALKAARKGYERLLAAIDALEKIAPSGKNATGEEVEELARSCREALDDDLNTPVLLARLFDGTRLVREIAGGKRIDAGRLERLKELYRVTVFNVLGMRRQEKSNEGILEKMIALLMETRRKARENKDWATSDRIRDEFKAAGIVIKDTRDGYEWSLENN